MHPPIQSSSCPRCGTVQAVPLASPRGPALRLRCQACHAPLPADDITRIGGALEVPAAPVDQRWHALVEGQLVGPLHRDEITDMHARGVLDDDTPVWHAGFAGWARLANTTTFARLCGGRGPAPRRRRPEVLDLTHAADLIEAVPPPAPRRGPPPLPRPRPAPRAMVPVPPAPRAAAPRWAAHP